MPDTKISGLTVITGANLATGDLFPVVDVSDTTMAASGTTKAVTRAELFSSTPNISVGGADAVISRYAAKQLLISGDGTGTASGMTGWILGSQAAVISGLWPSTAGTIDSTTSTILAGASYSIFGSSARSSYLDGNSFELRIGAAGAKLTQLATAGRGPDITAGTAADNTPRALSISQTWTDGTTGNIGIVGNFDMGATGTATGKLLSLQAGAAGTTEVFSVDQAGQMILPSGTAAAPSYAFATNTGLFRGATDTNAIVFTSAGFAQVAVSASGVPGLQLSGDSLLSWSTANSNPQATKDTAFSRVSAGVAGVGTGAAGAVDGTLSLNQIVLSKTITSVGTTGAQTINKSSGRVNFAIAATSLVVTNSLVTANSIITCTAATNDGTGRVINAVAASGSFTINVVAPAAEMAVDFRITN